MQEHLQDYLTQTISIYDTDKESFYHGLILGLYAIMNNLYIVKSNRESGNGRYDIQMEPIDKNSPGIIVEIKVLNKQIKENESLIKDELEQLSIEAINQIDNKHYEKEMINNGIKDILKLGIAFYKKETHISFKENLY